jgi:hypothetical protein
LFDNYGIETFAGFKDKLPAQSEQYTPESIIKARGSITFSPQRLQISELKRWALGGAVISTSVIESKSFSDAHRILLNLYCTPFHM